MQIIKNETVLRKIWKQKLERGETLDCRLCGEAIRYKSELSTEHIVPKSKNPAAADDAANLAPAHRLCNNLKDCMSEEEWRRELAEAGGSIQRLMEIRSERKRQAKDSAAIKAGQHRRERDRMRVVVISSSTTYVQYNG
ncbi:MAG: HNH endonuclease [Rickettsiales bacterium]|jgi:hypothetical protein|nr:HNH endonuclease [Rickettsiales bacterium]